MMRLSSSSSAAGFRLLLIRNPVASTVVLGCICLLLPLVAGVKEPEIDLKTEYHDQDLARGVSTDAKYAHIASSSGHPDSYHLRRNKPNKSSFKKYIEDSLADQHGKEKKSIYDKKYFDYMPVEPKDSLDTPTDVSFAKRTNSRRFRRDADGAELRTKRNGPWIPYSVSGYSYPVPMILPGSVYLQYDTNNNYRPNLGNSYLPPAVFTPVPQPPDRSYLPPATQPTEPPGMIDSGTRFGGVTRPNVFAFDTPYDPDVERNYQLIPGPRPSTGNGNRQFPNSVLGLSKPTTRRPRPPSTTTPSPVVQHNSDDDFDWSSLGLSPDGLAKTTTRRPRPLSTTTPSPVVQHNSDDDFDWSTLGLSPDGIGSRVGGNDNTLNSKRREPSKCVWAIANCCSQFSDKIRYYCFEQNQCFGAFWGDNVCRGYYRMALAEIENYYNVV